MACITIWGPALRPNGIGFEESATRKWLPLRKADDNEDDAVSPQPFGPMGVAGEFFVASRKSMKEHRFGPRVSTSPRRPIGAGPDMGNRDHQ